MGKTAKRVALTIRMPEELHEALRKLAYETRTSINRIMVDALQEAILRQQTEMGSQ